MGRHTVVAVIMGLLLSVVLSQDCAWPDYFDLSTVRTSFKFAEEDRSWLTDIKVYQDIVLSVNWRTKSATRVYISSNDTLEITYIGEATKPEQQVQEKYRCVASYMDDIFLLRKLAGDTKDKGESRDSGESLHRCVQLFKRSRHVVQWRLGELTNNKLIDCTTLQFGDVSQWPLIWFPVREMSDDVDISRHLDILDNIPSCPDLDIRGYHMVIKGADENVPEACRNEFPSSRLEMECVAGEGLRIIPGDNKCKSFSFTSGSGVKLNCLGHWSDPSYMYVVLVPAAINEIHSFHCLRLNKDNPASGSAYFFFDTICSSEAIPTGSTFSELELKPQNIADICDDYSAGCELQSCNNSFVEKSACMKTCDTCPVDKDTLPLQVSDQNIVGAWVLQKRDSRESVRVTDTEFILPGLGTLVPYGTADDKRCLQPPSIMEGSTAYVVAKNFTNNGCSPRVTQIRFKSLTEAVVLLEVYEPAALRFDQFTGITTSAWCRNNLREVKNYGQLFQPYWPYSSVNQVDKETSGWFTLINEASDQTTSCGIAQDPYFYATHMKVKLEFFMSEKQPLVCFAEAMTDGEMIYKLDTQSCNGNNTAGSLRMACLASYEFDERYLAVIVNVAEGLEGGLLEQEYYCLLLPKEEYKSSLQIFLHTAGDCDIPNMKFVETHYRKPAARMQFVESYSSSDSLHKLEHTISLISLVILLSIM